jgi:hypothetical protein
MLAIIPGFAKIIERVPFSKYFETAETDHDVDENG